MLFRNWFYFYFIYAFFGSIIMTQYESDEYGFVVVFRFYRNHTIDKKNVFGILQ